MIDRTRRGFLQQAGGFALAGAITPSVHRVKIEKMAFVPALLTVMSGDRIEWRNEDLVPHTVTEAGKVFDSGSIASGATWVHTVQVPGEYAYVCSFHPTMRAVLKVK